ncbi:MAG: phenylacetate-CoA oxygenase subunit PaaJ [Flavobacteriales bacterium]|nr:phenylacetate-CoA oxygenase subunit PaaJ [Flavobacteriales bacterium]
MQTKLSPQHIREILKEVKDPEIPTISIVDLGIVSDIRVEDDTVFVELTPTFAGCPALKIMENLVKFRLLEEGIEHYEVRTSFDKQWNSDMISEEGLLALKKHGLAPPVRHCGNLDLTVLEHTPCPYCGSENTELRNPFGPTLCRSIHYCNNCKQAFEGFKPVD